MEDIQTKQKTENRTEAHLLEREDIGAEPHPLPFVALNRLGDASDGDAAGQHDILSLPMVELDEPGIGRATLLAVLETDVTDDIETEADGAYGGLRGLLRRGSARHRRAQPLIPAPCSRVQGTRVRSGEGSRDLDPPARGG